MISKMLRVLVCGSGGFIGGHLTQKLKKEGYWIRGVDLKRNEFDNDLSDEFREGDLRDKKFCFEVTKGIDYIFQLAADMGGAGYLFSGDYDAQVMSNSCSINLNILEACMTNKVKRIFFSSSACVYPEFNQGETENPVCSEDSVYPAQPDSEYGWEKLFSERLYLAYSKNTDLEIRIGRFHNIFGPMGTWEGGKEKAPAAICRKVSNARNGDDIEIWGDGKQTRSFLFIDECVEAVIQLMNSDFDQPINIGSEELISINDFALMVISIADKDLQIKHIDGPLGVRGRNSDNRLIKSVLSWSPSMSLVDGVTKTYNWINSQVHL